MKFLVSVILLRLGMSIIITVLQLFKPAAWDKTGNAPLIIFYAHNTNTINLAGIKIK